MKKVIEKRKDIAFYIILYPITQIHPDAYEKSKAIFCEKSLAMLEDVFAKKTLPKPTCETTVIDENIELAKKLGIRGTPAMIFPDGIIVAGLRDAEAIIKLIDKK